MVPQALAPTGTPIRITAEHFGRMPRVYIECLRDRVISLSIQKMMYTATLKQDMMVFD